MKRLALILLLVATAVTSQAQSSDRLLGFYAGIGGAFPTGSLHDNFDGCVNFTGGLEGGYKHFVLKADVSYGQPSFNGKNLFQVLDSEGRDAQLNAAASASLLGVSAQVGYMIRVGRRLSITPATGIRWNRYSWEVNDIEWSKNPDGLDVFQAKNTSRVTLSNVGWMASIDFDLRLHDRYVSNAPLMNGQARYTSSLRITPWVARASFSKTVPAVRGCFVGFNVCYFGLLSKIMQ